MVLSIFSSGKRRFLEDSVTGSSGFRKKINIWRHGDQSEGDMSAPRPAGVLTLMR